MTTQTQTDTRLRGRRLALARLVWVLLVLLAGTAFSIGLIIRYQEFQRVCDQPTVSCNYQQLLTPENARQLANQGLSLQFYAFFQIGHALLSAAVWCGVALFIFITRSDDWLALIIALFLFSSGTQGGYWQSAARLYPVLTLPVQFLTSLNWVTRALFYALFPNGRWVPRWMRWVVAIWIIVFILPADITDQFPSFFGALLLISFFAGGLFAQAYRYRRVSTITERLQTKWVLYGIAISWMSVIASAILLLFFPALNSLGSPGNLVIQSLHALLLLFIPLSIGMAVLHSHLWDIEVIIRRTLIYGALTATLALAYFGIVVVLQELFQAITGQHQSPAATVISTLAIAALFTPLRRRIQRGIDRRFYRRKYDAQKTLESFAAKARDVVEIDQLTAQLVAAVQDTMQPEQVSLWLRKSARGPASVQERTS